MVHKLTDRRAGQHFILTKEILIQWKKNKLQIICNYSNTTSFFFQCHSCPHNFQHETNHHICHKQPSFQNWNLESPCRRRYALSTYWKDVNAFLFKTAQKMSSHFKLVEGAQRRVNSKGYTGNVCYGEDSTVCFSMLFTNICNFDYYV